MSAPLTGLRIVSLAPNLPGPIAAARLCSLGAEVTKVEPPAGDLLAQASPAFYTALTAGQDVRTLDLRTPEAHAELAALLDEAHLLLTSSRLEALARLGLRWEDLHTRFPQLSWVAIIGHAEDSSVPGHDLTYQAAAGLIEPPHMPLSPVADIAGGERAAGLATALMLAAHRTGEGGFGTVALADVAAEFAVPLRHGLTGTRGLLGGAAPQYGLYRAAQGWVAVAAVEPHFWQRLCALLELPPDGAGLAEALTARPAAEWEAWARQHDMPLVAVRTADTTADSTRYEER